MAAVTLQVPVQQFQSVEIARRPEAETFLVADFFAARRVHFSFSLLARLFVVTVFLDIGKNAGPFTGFCKPPEGLFKRFIFF
jgi:hypothetical protein